MILNNKIQYKTDKQIIKMREAALVTIAGLDASVSSVMPGVTPRELDAVFADTVRSAGAVSNFLGYHDYPNTTCISVNEVLVHGIPNDLPLVVGDILSIDAGCSIDGWHSDSARTVIVGGGEESDPDDVRLSEVTEKALWTGIAAFATAKHVGDIGVAIEEYVESVSGEPLSIVEDFVGHGIGTAMHQAPDVFHYAISGSSPKVKPGMVLAIEPMLVRGNSADSVLLSDGWTVASKSGARCAQWEHSVALHSGGVWVLTAADGGASGLAEFGIVPVPLLG